MKKAQMGPMSAITMEAIYPSLTFDIARAQTIMDEIDRATAKIREEATEEMQVRLIEAWLDASRSCPLCSDQMQGCDCACCKGLRIVWE